LPVLVGAVLFFGAHRQIERPLVSRVPLLGFKIDETWSMVSADDSETRL
jgi:hypothetical protein